MIVLFVLLIILCGIKFTLSSILVIGLIHVLLALYNRAAIEDDPGG